MTELMHDPDAGDVAQAKSGCAEAFARLYDRHAAVVLSLCRRGSLAEAEDAMQETFIRAFRKLETLDDPANFRAWLYAIAARACSEKRRAEGRRAKHEARARAMGVVNNNGHVDEVEKAEQLALLSEALDQLPDQERLAIHLHYLDADPVAAAMPVLGVSRSGFYKLLARARKRLAEMLAAKPQPNSPSLEGGGWGVGATAPTTQALDPPPGPLPAREGESPRRNTESFVRSTRRSNDF